MARSTVSILIVLNRRRMTALHLKKERERMRERERMKQRSEKKGNQLKYGQVGNVTISTIILMYLKL